jgi:hypothetical protein
VCDSAVCAGQLVGPDALCVYIYLFSSGAFETSGAIVGCAGSVRNVTRADVAERGDRREARADKSPLPYVPDAETLTNANADGPRPKPGGRRRLID